MLVTYTLQVVAFDMMLKCLPREIEKTEMLIVFKMHNLELTLTNDDIVRRREVTFILNVPSAQLIPESVTMDIRAYKYHPTGIKILIGRIEINIKIFVNFALTTMGEIVAIPGYYVLKNPTGVTGGILNSTIQLMIVDETLLGFEESDLYPSEPPQDSKGDGNGPPENGKTAGVSKLEAFCRL
ncbi:hypothetical protein CBL_13073 [Carabus blaptoides fortunei]